MQIGLPSEGNGSFRFRSENRDMALAGCDSIHKQGTVGFGSIGGQRGGVLRQLVGRLRGCIDHRLLCMNRGSVVRRELRQHGASPFGCLGPFSAEHKEHNVVCLAAQEEDQCTGVIRRRGRGLVKAGLRHMSRPLLDARSPSLQ